MHASRSCEIECECAVPSHSPKFVVITGGPGAGKTAVLEMARKNFCKHVAVLPEAASLVFSGGFWRLPTDPARMAAQRAIYHVQLETENVVRSESQWALALCDRGTLDGLAYWPADEELYFKQLGTSLESELARYSSIIHLRTPSAKMGYNHQNHLRIETAEQAGLIDLKIEKIWSRHPRYMQVESSESFLKKAAAVLRLIADDVPECCRTKNVSI